MRSLCFVVFLLFLYSTQSSPSDNVKVKLSFYQYNHDKVDMLIVKMRTGKGPPNHSHMDMMYTLNKVSCNNRKTFDFSINDQKFSCPTSDAVSHHKINSTHAFSCPIFCDVCKQNFTCSRILLSGVIYTPDGRKKDPISPQYGTLGLADKREINWVTFCAYITLYTVLVNVIVLVFTEE